MSRSGSRFATAALVAAVLASGAPAVAEPRGEFDIQAHRGGLGLRSESTLSSFGNGLRVGVSTLELDIQVTEDGEAVVTHDRRVSGATCVDTGPVTPGLPYVGGYVKDLTLAQVRTLDCGSERLADRPEQEVTPAGSRSCPTRSTTRPRRNG